MTFSSYIFVFILLPVTLTGYFLIGHFVLSRPKRRTCQNLLLLAASLYFYAYFNLSYLPIILSSILVNFGVAKMLVSSRNGATSRRGWYWLGVAFNVGLLGYFKYYGFFIENVNALFRTDFTLMRFILPLGISFFTLQQLAFILAVYRGEERPERFTDYALFVSFFPQLVAGPIVLYSEMMPQFTDERNRTLNFDNLAQGWYVFVIGLFKKVVAADTIALFANTGFEAAHLSMPAAWVTVLSYAMQIYFDFSGYSDMAVGLGKMVNIDIPVNFLSPYKSESITEFWRRWHITLGRVLSTFVYIPLGGNRKGKARTYLNLIVTFFISGLWHGAAWTFVLWGVLHGLISAFERMCKGALDRIPSFLRVAGTFIAVSLLWVLFRAENLSVAASVYRSLVNIRDVGFSSVGVLAVDGIANFSYLAYALYVSAIMIALMYVVFFRKNAMEMAQRFVPSGRTLAFTAVLFVLSVVHLSRESIFIYFNF